MFSGASSETIFRIIVWGDERLTVLGQAMPTSRDETKLRGSARGAGLHQIAVWLDPVQLQRFEIDAKRQCLLLHEGDNAMKP
jgi:hypothetical protein